ncbi:MAG TPA: DoxX family protein [Pyrinomonadaceae bacterium]|jgi:hypothetical protein|nr:DoxX family protein [Pyrinomonadaceae bacterium]
MKNERIIYWTSTAIIAAIMCWSALNFAFNPDYRGAFQHFGLPNWFSVELTTAKLLGVSALVIPAVPQLIKEFAYFGFGLTLISAPIAHLSSGDSVLFEIGHSFFFITLIVSYVYFHKLERRYK